MYTLTAARNSDLTIGNRKDKAESDPFYDWQKKTDTKWSFVSTVNLPENHDEAGLNGWSGEAWAKSSGKYAWISRACSQPSLPWRR